MGVSVQNLLVFSVTLKIILTFNLVSGQIPGVSQFEARSTYREVLDPAQGLALGWRVDSNTRRIMFHVEVPSTEGYVLLGLTIRQRLDGADVIMVGNGGAYVQDMHSVDNGTIRLDTMGHWQLIGVDNNGAGRVVHLWRNLDTCDPQDIPIKGDLIDVVWSYSANGNNQSLPTTLQPQGVKPLFFQDPITLPISTNVTQIRADANVWRLRKSYRVPARRTSYWCSINKMPSLSRQHHIVGFSVYFDSPQSRRHVHHHLLYRCSVPLGIDPAKLFESYANQPGEECFLNTNPKLPTPFCREFVYIWTVGGEPVMLPETMGIPVGDTPNEYFLLETHYDNPEERGDLEVVTGVDLFYSSQLRPRAGSILMVGYGTLGTFVVPPTTTEFNIAGHCGKACTALMLGLSPTRILGVSLHAHQATRKMRLRHFRGVRELPWIQDDQDYHFDYQQSRFHPEPVTLSPADQLTVQCTYDISDRNGSAISYGFSTLDEMCLAFLYVDRRLPYLTCTSEYPTALTMARFGILNMTWDVDRTERVVHAALNRNNIGRTLSEVVETHTQWTPERVQQVEDAQMYQGHGQSCPPWRLVGLGLEVTSLLGPVQDLIEAFVKPTLSTLQTPPTNPLPVTFPPVTTAYAPPSCPVTG